MVLWVLDRLKRVSTDRKNYGRAFVISAFLVLATEIAQHFTPERSFQVRDVLNDLVGEGVFLVIAYQYMRILPRRSRVLSCSTASVSLLICCQPVVVAVTDGMRARMDSPVLGSFETRWEMERWKPVEGSFRRVSMCATDGNNSLETVLSSGLYPGLTMDYPSHDWQGYDTLTLYAFLSGSVPLPLAVRINDLAQDRDGSADLTYVLKVASQLGDIVDEYKIVVDKSTVPVGTAEMVRDTVRKRLDARGLNHLEFDVVSNPEFLKEGNAIQDFMRPDRVIVGTDNVRTAELLKELYGPFVQTTNNPVIVMDIRSAELTKYVSNCFLAAKVTFMNELAILYPGFDSGSYTEMIKRAILWA